MHKHRVGFSQREQMFDAELGIPYSLARLKAVSACTKGAALCTGRSAYGVIMVPACVGIDITSLPSR